MISAEALEELARIVGIDAAMDTRALGTVCMMLEHTDEDFLSGSSDFTARALAKFAEIHDGEMDRARQAMALMVACGDYDANRALAPIGCDFRSMTEIASDALKEIGDAKSPEVTNRLEMAASLEGAGVIDDNYKAFIDREGRMIISGPAEDCCAITASLTGFSVQYFDSPVRFFDKKFVNAPEQTFDTLQEAFYSAASRMEITSGVCAGLK